MPGFLGENTGEVSLIDSKAKKNLKDFFRKENSERQ